MKEHKKETQVPASAAKRSWKKMELSYLGDAAQLIQGGGGKLSLVGGDTGDSRKPPGGG